MLCRQVPREGNGERVERHVRPAVICVPHRPTQSFRSSDIHAEFMDAGAQSDTLGHVIPDPHTAQDGSSARGLRHLRIDSTTWQQATQ
eukprot:scaffold5287_cov345-Prasinococcus_capsulatus_cf.AAC.5